MNKNPIVFVLSEIIGGCFGLIFVVFFLPFAYIGKLTQIPAK
jgi:hypothetical protein